MGRLEVEGPDREKLEQLFAELEFRTLGKRVFGEDFTITGGQAAQAQQTDLFGNQVAAPSAGRRTGTGGKTGSADHSVASGTGTRSEEHTSELQSLMRISYAVFCLKKKKKTQ